MENWKPVYGYEGYYEVSDLGRIRSLECVVKSSCRNGGSRIRPSKVLKQNRKRNGYLTVDLCKNGKIKTATVHRIVANAFYGPRPDMQVNHINADKSDNRASNLEWCTAAENQAHIRGIKKFDNGFKKALRCKETGQVFESSYQAAAWVNENVKQFSGSIPVIARGIRGAASGAHKSAFGYHWEDVA